MRVLQVLHNHPPEFDGGVERYVVATVAGLRSAGHHPAVLCGSERTSAEPAIISEIWDGTPVYRLVRGPGFRTPLDPLEPALVPLYEQVLKSVRPDVVHVHHWWNLGSDLVRRAVARGFPAVLTLHDFFSTCSLFFRMPDGQTPCPLAQHPDHCAPCVGTRFGLDEPEVRWLIGLRGAEFRAEIEAAGAVLVPSLRHGERLRRFLGMERDFLTIPLGSPALEPLSAEGSPFPSGPLRILHFGNLSRLKGVELLARAAALADPAGDRIRLVLAGEAVEKGLDLGRAERVGRYDLEALRRLAARADLAVFPSLAMESYGLVVDEALRLGLPVVVSDRGALSERSGGRGIVVSVDGPLPLAELLRGFLDRPERLRSLRVAPLPELLDPAQHALKLVAVYEEARRRPPPPVDLEGGLLRRISRTGDRVQELMELIGQLRPGAAARKGREMNGPKRELTDATVAAAPRASRVPGDDTGLLVSVITRTRNRPDLLREAVASVAAQEWPHKELIVVNDGGDDVAPVLDAFRDRLDIRSLTPGRVGRCRAGNLGLEAARGTWIAWLDDDDLHYPDHLATLVPRLRESGFKFAYSDAHRIDQERGHPGEKWREVARTVPYSEDFSRIMLFRRAYIHLVTVVFHRECWERIGGFDESLEVLEDWDLFFRFAQDYDFLHVKKVTAAFRVRNDFSNAVTALRRQFVETRSRLFARYIHLAFPEMLGLLEHGQQLLGELKARVARLEEEAAQRPAPGSETMRPQP